MRSPLRSPAQVEGPQGVLPQPEKDLERPSSTRLEARFPYYDLRVKTAGTETYTGPLELKPALPSLLEAERTGDFEGVFTWVLGLSEATDFRVTTLDGPPRLVIDVAHP